LLEYVTVAGELSEEEIDMLKKWGKTRSSIYQVVRVKNDVVALKDVLRSGEVEVSDPDIVQELMPGQLLFIRVLPVGEGFEFSTGGLVLPFYSKDYIVSRISLDAESFWRNSGRLGRWDIFLQRRAHIINALVMETASVVWSLGEKYDQELDGDGIAPHRASKRATNLFLEHFYERWVNEPMDVLQGQTPLEAARTQAGRDKLQSLLQELLETGEQVGDKDEQRDRLAKIYRKLNMTFDEPQSDEPRSDEPQAEPSQQLSLPEDDAEQFYPKVSELIRKGLQEMGYQAKQIGIAEKMWQEYSKIVSPTFKKPETWAAAVIYAVTNNSGNKLINQTTLAVKYNISASIISSNYRSFYRTLQRNKLWDL